jgi:hypothetical protein
MSNIACYKGGHHKACQRDTGQLKRHWDGVESSQCDQYRITVMKIERHVNEFGSDQAVSEQ